MTKEKNKNTQEENKNKKNQKEAEEIFNDLPLGCDCSSCPRKCN